MSEYYIRTTDAEPMAKAVSKILKDKKIFVCIDTREGMNDRVFVDDKDLYLEHFGIICWAMYFNGEKIEVDFNGEEIEK